MAEEIDVSKLVMAVLKLSTLANEGFTYELPEGEDGVYRG